MAHCYRCGAAIDAEARHPRRKVPTGGWTSRAYPAAKVRASKTRYGLRVVCRRCARLIDLAERRLEVAENVKLGVALAVLLGLAAWWSLR